MLNRTNNPKNYENHQNQLLHSHVICRFLSWSDDHGLQTHCTRRWRGHRTDGGKDSREDELARAVRLMKPVGLKAQFLELDPDHEEAMGEPIFGLLVCLLLCKRRIRVRRSANVGREAGRASLQARYERD